MPQRWTASSTLKDTRNIDANTSARICTQCCPHALQIPPARCQALALLPLKLDLALRLECVRVLAPFAIFRCLACRHAGPSSPSTRLSRPVSIANHMLRGNFRIRRHYGSNSCQRVQLMCTYNFSPLHKFVMQENNGEPNIAPTI